MFDLIREALIVFCISYTITNLFVRFLNRKK